MDFNLSSTDTYCFFSPFPFYLFPFPSQQQTEQSSTLTPRTSAIFIQIFKTKNKIMYTLKLQDKEYKVSGFSYLVMRQLARVWELDTITQVEKKLQEIFKGVDKMSFKAFDGFGQIVKAIIVAENTDFDVSVDVIVNELMTDDSFRTEIEYIITDSMQAMQKKNTQQPTAKSQKHKK